MVSPSARGRTWPPLLVLGRGQQVAQVDGLAALVGQFDADGVAARHHRDAAGGDAHRAGDVVGQGHDAGRLHPGGGDQLVEGDHGAGADLVDLAAHAELGQHALQQLGVLAQRAFVELRRRAAWAWPAWPARAGWKPPSWAKAKVPWASRCSRPLPWARPWAPSPAASAHRRRRSALRARRRRAASGDRPGPAVLLRRATLAAAARRGLGGLRASGLGVQRGARPSARPRKSTRLRPRP